MACLTLFPWYKLTSETRLCYGMRVMRVRLTISGVASSLLVMVWKTWVRRGWVEKRRAVRANLSNCIQINYGLSTNYIRQLRMRPVRTNLLRMDFNTQHCLYEVEVTLHSHTLKEVLNQVEAQIAAIMPFALYQHPLLYNPQPLPKTLYYSHLSDGTAFELRLTQLPANHSQTLVPVLGSLISQKLLSLTQLLYSPIFAGSFNPLEQVLMENERVMPGWRLGVEMGESGGMLSVQGVRLSLSDAGGLGEQSQVLLDYDCGKFFLKQNIVRIDKEKGEVIFRNNHTSRRSALYSATIAPINGYPLAANINKLLERIHHTSKEFSGKWELKFDTRFIEVQGSYTSVGVLGFRDNVDKSVSELVSPMNFQNYLYNYINFFTSVKFDDLLRANIVYLVDNDKTRQDYVVNLRKEMEKVAVRMDLEAIGKTVFYNNYGHLQELVTLLSNQPTEINRIYVIAHSKAKDKTQVEPFQKFNQFLISGSVVFHMLQVDNNPEHNFQALAYHHLSVIYTKFRLNPWKLKNIPFMNQPMMVLALHIQPTKQKLYSLSLVATMNLFFTKFTAVHRITAKDTLSTTLEKGLIECIETFRSKHQKYPNRVFMIRSGTDAEEQLDLEKTKAEVRSRGGQLTYVTLYNEHRIRIYNQMDINHPTKDTVKKVQLNLNTIINRQLYFQIELQTPPYRVRVNPLPQNDPTFTQRVLDLLQRVVMGGVGHSYGKGLGILDYPRKLNAYKEYNLAAWQSLLTEGILLFL